MALFTDGPPAVIEDLRRYDSQAASLSSEAAIDLDAKLCVAAEEVGQEIFKYLLFRCPTQGSLASLFLSGSPSEAARERLGLSDVVVSPALRRWHAMRALAGLYRDAYGSDVNDRYLQKWNEYEKLANQAADYCFATGIGLCWKPVPKAPVALVTQTSEATTRTDCTVYVTWVNGSGQEGAPSDAWPASLGPGDDISPSGPSPDGITGWNVYVATDTIAAARQNGAALDTNSEWTVPAGGIQVGASLADGQKADYLVVDRRVLSRG